MLLGVILGIQSFILNRAPQCVVNGLHFLGQNKESKDHKCKRKTLKIDVKVQSSGQRIISKK